MKLKYTEKYFPKTYKYISNYKSAISLNDLIHKYSLKGLTLRSSKDGKDHNILPNPLDNAEKYSKDEVPIKAVNRFNDKLQVSHNSVISYQKGDAPVIIDRWIYQGLDNFVRNYCGIPSQVDKYVDYDQLLLDSLRHNNVHLLVLRAHGYFIADLYTTDKQFYYSIRQLVTLESAFMNSDVDYIHKIVTTARKKLRHDGKLFNKYIRPTLPLMMTYSPSYYREQEKHATLLYVLCARFKV